MNEFSHKIAAWYKQNHRSLPWRETADPYAIWLSEVILQQTRVDQGMGYYQRFLSQWPDVLSLSLASEQEVLKLWQGLGYYSRARNLLTTAKMIVNNFEGAFPADYKQLLSLKGVGKYTAAAVGSIAFGLPNAVVDGNVMRVLSRVFGVQDAIDGLQGIKKIEKLANALLDKENPGLHNQALMEFGALHCVPASPDCMSCIFNHICIANQKGLVSQLPFKQKKITLRVRYLNYFICTYKQGEDCFVALKIRTSGDIWKGLYDFPLIETSEEVEIEFLINNNAFLDWTNNRNFTLSKVSDLQKHQLTHQTLFARFFHLRFHEPIAVDTKNGISLVCENSMNDYPFPRLIDRYLQNIDLINC
ncbi:MAG: A/G-specific adenine glycosylase [Bacteroidales bacterium]|nr:A/G-specific adenine glycosylase [Bacteroidales bacterium]